MKPLNFDDVAVRLGDTVIWSHATFEIEPASITAVLGPNGAGKSTLLKVVLGLIEPSDGALRVLGAAPARGNPRVGYMAQSRHADSLTSITARDYVGLGFDGRRFGWGRSRDKHAVVERALALTGVTSYADQPLGTLSGGQRQRVALAHAAVFQPDLLLLDEPLAGLDLAAQAEIVDLINLIRDTTGAAIIVVAHDLNPLASIVDCVLWIARRQVRCGKVDEVVNAAVLSELYGHPIEIFTTAHGRRVIVGLEEEFAHPHPHGHDHYDHVHEEPHSHLEEIYREETS
ncbi:MAG: ATP-binding cassette domain-containing protein [Acidobacteriota bacterium]|nr:ATP-binding cassette domain-containing protein [Acidobacteriota bacterium]